MSAALDVSDFAEIFSNSYSPAPESKSVSMSQYPHDVDRAIFICDQGIKNKEMGEFDLAFIKSVIIRLQGN